MFDPQSADMSKCKRVGVGQRMLDRKRKKTWSLEDNVDTWTQFGSEAPDIVRFIIGGLLRRKKLIVFCSFVFLLLGLAFGLLKQPTYTASSQLLVFTKELQPGSDAVLTLGRTDTSLVQNQVEVLQSRNVLLKVIEALKLRETGDFSPRPPGIGQIAREWLAGPAKTPAAVNEDTIVMGQVLEWMRRNLSVHRSGTSHTIMVNFKDSDPTTAARIVNEIVQVYLRDRGGTLDPDAADNPWLRERLIGLGPNATVISEAEPPIRPDGPRLIVLLIGSILAGGFVGCLVALAIEASDRKIRTSDQVEDICGAECLGIVPEFRRGRSARKSARASQEPPGSEALSFVLNAPSYSDASQTFRRIRASLLERNDTLVLGITSTLAGEGVTTMSSNLAHFLAKAGSKVLLIDADFQRCALSRVYASGPRLGLSDLITDKILLQQAVLTTNVENLHFLPVGQSSAREMDLNWNAHIDSMLQSTRSAYDAIIIDLPPISVGAELRVAVKSIDALLLVVRWGVTEANAIKAGLRLLGRGRMKLAGVVMNRVSSARLRIYGDRRFLSDAVASGADRSGGYAAGRTAVRAAPPRQSVAGLDNPGSAVERR